MDTQAYADYLKKYYSKYNDSEILQAVGHINCELKVLERKRQYLLSIYKKEDGEKDKLGKKDIEKFSRQIMLPNIRSKGQISLKNGSALIVGVGGLGSPAAIYLAAAGIGHLGLVDFDVVEKGNIHRQVIHNQFDVGRPKVDSAADFIARLSSDTVVTRFKLILNKDNIADIIAKFDVILDCCDNVPTRYLINDACVMAGKAIVCASALKMEGQLAVYNYRSSPCYRCLYPEPPPLEAVNNCGDVGVLGPVCGVMGILQALEAIKIITNSKDSFAGRLLLFDGSECSFRNVNLRSKRSDCALCGTQPSIVELLDYEKYTGMQSCDRTIPITLLKDEERISAKDLNNIRLDKDAPLLVDVRPDIQYKMCHLSNCVNLPIELLQKYDEDNCVKSEVEKLNGNSSCESQIIVICRRGNDSQKAVQILKKYFDCEIRDVVGGLEKWAIDVDKTFPIY